jgi:hypothetical protein
VHLYSSSIFHSYKDNMKQNRDQQIIWVLLPFFSVAGISSYIAQNFVVSLGKAIFTVYLFLLVFILSKYNKRESKAAGWPIWPILMTSMISLGYFRTYFFDSVLVGLPSSIIMTINYFLIFLAAKLIAERCTLLRADKVMLSSFHFFFIFNFMLYLVGFSNPAGESGHIGEMESIFKFIKIRQVLPFAIGQIDSSIICLITYVGAILLYRQIDPKSPRRVSLKLFYLLLIFLSLLMMILSGGRTAIALAFVLLLLSFFVIETKKKTIFLITAISFFFPLFYLPLVIPLYSSDALNFLEVFSRTGNISEIILLNNRVFIWGSVLNYLYENLKLFNLIFGYGFYGQTVSGAVDTYNFLFSLSYASIATINVHSSIIQIFVNYGLVGILVYCVTISKSLKFLFSNPQYNNILYLILTCIFATMVEAELAIDTYLLTLFIFLTSYLFSLNNIKMKTLSISS